MNKRTAVMLDRTPMLSGLVGVTLYELPKLAKQEVHGTVACYAHGGCRCDKCRLANADRHREWVRRSGRTRGTYPAVEARRPGMDGKESE